ncbi:MAG: hypothetical protein ACREDX_06615 [Aestuariivirga sp.]
MPKGPESIEEFIKALSNLKFGVNAPGVRLGWERRARKDGTISLPVKLFQDELKKLSLDELKTRHATEIQNQINSYRVKAEEDEAQRFLNQPYARADFEHWSKAAYWSIEEAVALSLGREPKVVHWKSVASYRQVSKFAQDYKNRRDLARGAAVPRSHHRQHSGA